MKQPPKDKKEIKKEKIIGDTAQDPAVTKRDLADGNEQQQQNEQASDDAEVTNEDLKITNTDTSNSSDPIAN